MHSDFFATRSLVSWGRPICRGELPGDSLGRFLARYESCEVVTENGRRLDCLAWLGSLREQGRMPAWGPRRVFWRKMEAPEEREARGSEPKFAATDALVTLEARGTADAQHYLPTSRYDVGCSPLRTSCRSDISP
jgi:hypothetical protein